MTLSKTTLLLGLLFAQLGCRTEPVSVTETEPEPEEEVDDCALGPPAEPANGAWECAGMRSAPEFSTPGGLRSVTAETVEILTRDPIADVHVTVCDKQDGACMNPSSPFFTDELGVADIEVPIHTPTYLVHRREGIPSHLTFPNGRHQNGFEWTLLTSATLDAFALILTGAQPDPARGSLGIEVRDCGGRLAAGVIIQVDLADEHSTIGYFNSAGTPDRCLPSTTKDGRVGVANVRPGLATVTALLAENGRHITRRTVWIHEGAVTLTVIDPTPEAL